MKTFKYFFLSLLITIIGVSCQKEEIADRIARPGEEGNVTLRFALPETIGVTKAPTATSSSARGGITNVDMSKYDIRYKLAVYSAAGQQVIAPSVKTVDKYEEITYEIRLTPNRTYKFVVWADFVKQGTDADLHYNTTDFTNVVCTDPADKQLNDESRDAYCIATDIAVGNDEINQTLVLHRPFAKLRVVTTDWGLVQADRPDYFEIKYYGTDCKRFKSINLLTGESTGESLTEKDDAQIITYEATINKDEKDYALSYDSDEHNRTLTVDYLMTDKSAQTPLHLLFSAYKNGKGGELVSTYDFKTSVPIQRNYLTTLLGNLLTTSTKIKVVIEENFIEEYNAHAAWFAPQGVTPVKPSITENDGVKTYHITSREEFMWFAGFYYLRADNVIFSLESDIDMNGIDWLPIMFRGIEMGKTYTFDGNGHTLRNFSVKRSIEIVSSLANYVSVFAIWSGTIKNVNFENITIDGSGIRAERIYAGIVGYSYRKSNYENVHATNVFINGGGLSPVIGGGLVAVSSSEGSTYKDCSVKNVVLQTNYGGGFGGIVGSIYSNATLTNCSADYVSMIAKYYELMLNYAGFGGLVGGIGDATNVKFVNCTAPEHLEFLKPDGTPDTRYNKYTIYGISSKGKPTIE